MHTIPQTVVHQPTKPPLTVRDLLGQQVHLQVYSAVLCAKASRAKAERARLKYSGFVGLGKRTRGSEAAK